MIHDHQCIQTYVIPIPKKSVNWATIEILNAKINSSILELHVMAHKQTWHKRHTLLLIICSDLFELKVTWCNWKYQLHFHQFQLLLKTKHKFQIWNCPPPSLIVYGWYDSVCPICPSSKCYYYTTHHLSDIALAGQSPCWGSPNPPVLVASVRSSIHSAAGCLSGNLVGRGAAQAKNNRWSISSTHSLLIGRLLLKNINLLFATSSCASILQAVDLFYLHLHRRERTMVSVLEITDRHVWSVLVQNTSHVKCHIMVQTSSIFSKVVFL